MDSWIYIFVFFIGYHIFSLVANKRYRIFFTFIKTVAIHLKQIKIQKYFWMMDIFLLRNSISNS